jgi:outer membrane lipoprotein carrier protein
MKKFFNLYRIKTYYPIKSQPMKQLGILFVFLSLFFATSLFSISGDEAVQKFQSRMRRLVNLTGVISWTTYGGQTYVGSFKYLAPGKIYVKFTSPFEKILVSNGKTLWIYTPGNKMCGIHELIKGTSSGLAAMIESGYNSVATGGDTGYTIKLISDKKQYREIILSVDTTFLLKGAILKREDNRMSSFTLSETSTKAEVNENLFNFKVPKGVQVVKNPVNIR